MNKLTSNDLSVGKAYWITEYGTEAKRVVVTSLTKQEKIGGMVEVKQVGLYTGNLNGDHEFFATKNDCINFLIEENKNQSEIEIERLESMKTKGAIIVGTDHD